MSNLRKLSRSVSKAKKAAKAAPAAGGGNQPVRALISLTEVPGTGGGFTLGLGLHGAHMSAIDPTQEDKSTEVSSVDIAALALSYIVRTNPPAFVDAINLVRETLANSAKQIAAGRDAAEAMHEANTILSGSAPPPSNDPELPVVEDASLPVTDTCDVVA